MGALQGAPWSTTADKLVEGGLECGCDLWVQPRPRDPTEFGAQNTVVTDRVPKDPLICAPWVAISTAGLRAVVSWWFRTGNSEELGWTVTKEHLPNVVLRHLVLEGAVVLQKPGDAASGDVLHQNGKVLSAV